MIEYEPIHIREYDQEVYDERDIRTRKYHVIIAETYLDGANWGDYRVKRDLIRLVYDEDGELTELPNTNVDTVQHYRYALTVCSVHDELRHHVPVLIRWLHDHNPEEVLRL